MGGYSQVTFRSGNLFCDVAAMRHRVALSWQEKPILEHAGSALMSRARAIDAFIGPGARFGGPF